MDAIKEELNLYKDQINELNGYKQAADKEINTLLSRVDDLETLLQKANVANHDLFTAFSHIRDENAIIKSTVATQPNQVVDPSDGMFDWARNTIGSIRTHEAMKRQIKSLQRDRDRCLKENTRLSRQVRHLLRKLETEKGRIVPDLPKEVYGSVITGSDIINMNLLTFGSIEELHHNNQRLLALVHDLSEKQEIQQQHIESEDRMKLFEEVNQLKQDLDKVTEDRQKVLEKFETIMKERDLLKILLSKSRDIEHMTPEIFQNMVAVACTSTSTLMAPPDTTDKDKHIKDLQETVLTLRQEISDEKENHKTLHRRMTEELTLKTSLLEKAHLYAKELQAECDKEKEKSRTLDTNINTLMAEFEDLRTKHQKLTLEVQQQDTQSVVDAKDALISEIRFAIESKSTYITKLEQQQQESLELVKAKENQLSQLTVTLSTLVQSNEQQTRRLSENIVKLHSQDMQISELKGTIFKLEEEIRRKPEPLPLPLSPKPKSPPPMKLPEKLYPSDLQEASRDMTEQIQTLVLLRTIERNRRLKTIKKLRRVYRKQAKFQSVSRANRRHNQVPKRHPTMNIRSKPYMETQPESYTQLKPFEQTEPHIQSCFNIQSDVNMQTEVQVQDELIVDTEQNIQTGQQIQTEIPLQTERVATPQHVPQFKQVADLGQVVQLEREPRSQLEPVIDTNTTTPQPQIQDQSLDEAPRAFKLKRRNLG